MKSKLLKQYPFEVAMFVTATLLSMLPPLLLGYLIDNIILAQDFSRLVPWFAGTLAAAIVASAMSFYFISYMTTKKCIVNSTIVSNDCIKRLLKMPLPFYEKQDKSYYLNVVTNSAFTYGDLHAQLYLELVGCAISIVVILAFTVFVNPFFGLIFLLFLPLVVGVSWLRGGKLAEMQKNMMRKQDTYLGSLNHIINSKREINILKENDHFSEAFSQHNWQWNKYMLKYRFNQYLMEQLPTMLAGVYAILFLFIGAIFVSRGAVTPGELIMEYQFLQLLSSPVSRIAETIVRKKANKEHIDRVDSFEAADLEDHEHKKRETEENKLFTARDFALNVNNPQAPRLFSTDSMDVPNRGLYIVKGQNGTGKSMLLNFMFGTMDVKFGEGQFTFAKNITERTAFLTYPLFFTDGSFQENLFGREYDKALLDILNIDFADKQITTNPINLSLGQQQKIALLRVLSMEYDFLFLDEPFSNLDVETQEKLRGYIKSIKAHKAVVVIMHDDSFDSLADSIYRIEDLRLTTTTPQPALK